MLQLISARHLALVAISIGPSALAQSFTFTARSGENIAFCGAPTGGPLVDHRFMTTDPTDDTVSVTDDGGGVRQPSSGTSHLMATASPSSLMMGDEGASMRGAATGQGAYAVGDGRDTWVFTLSSPACFRLVVSLSASSTEATVPSQAFNFFANGAAQIHPTGSPTTTVISHALTTPGSYSVEITGTLSAGEYALNLFGRSDANSSPFSGSFHNFATLHLTACACSADFNDDGDLGTDADIGAFFACLGGNCCATCGTADFNGDGDTGTDSDIESFFRVLGGGAC